MFHDVFLQTVTQKDQHSSHEALYLLEEGLRQNIKILGLPALTKHYLCLLDRTTTLHVTILHLNQQIIW